MISATILRKKIFFRREFPREKTGKNFGFLSPEWIFSSFVPPDCPTLYQTITASSPWFYSEKSLYGVPLRIFPLWGSNIAASYNKYQKECDIFFIVILWWSKTEIKPWKRWDNRKFQMRQTCNTKLIKKYYLCNFEYNVI